MTDPPAADRPPSGEDWRAARRVVRRVVTAGGHLTYEQLETLADRGDAAVPEPAAQAHLRWCPRCRDELADLRRHATVLRQPPRATRPSPGGRLAAWFGGGPRWAGLAAACGVAAVALLVGRLPLQEPGGSAVLRTAPAPASQAGSEPAAAALDSQAFMALDRVSPAAVAAYRAGDYAGLAALLRPAAAHGSAPAAAALGLLHAQGLGVPHDLALARRYLEQAAQAGDPSARHNLGVVQRWQ